MSEEKTSYDDILIKCTDIWFNRFSGISAIEIGEIFNISNKKVMKIFEQFELDNKGKINSNVVLYSVEIDINKKWEKEFPECKKVITHIFFPSKAVLENYFYLSSVSRQNIPEYKKRLYLGGNQIELVFFRDEVLKRYYDHPEIYEIEDTLAGGKIISKGDSIDENFIYVRYGKKLINNGKISVTAILKDLESMSPDEQKYWSAFELNNFLLDSHDQNFKLFLQRTYDGEYVDFPNIFKELEDTIIAINNKCNTEPLFNIYSNTHLRPPVENTYKSFCDSCSELYKLIGPDNINSSVLKLLIYNVLKIDGTELINKKSERPLSTVQMLKLFENRFEDIELTKTINQIKDYRIEADHKVIEATQADTNYVELFYKLCNSIMKEYKEFTSNIFK